MNKTVVKPSSKRRSRIITAGKPPSYRRRRTERTTSEDPLTTAWDMRRTTYKPVKEEPSAGGAGKCLVVEGVVGVPSGVGGDGAEEAFFDRDADGAPDRHLATHEGRLEGVLGIEEAAPVVLMFH